jgi:hypothetical protein
MFTKEQVDSMISYILDKDRKKEKDEFLSMSHSETNNLNNVYESWKDRYVIIRSYASGVHFGVLDIYDPITRHVLLKNCRRIWSWSGALTLTEVSISGIKSGKLSAFKDEMIISQVEEIVPTSEESKECLLKFSEHKI